MDIITLHRKGLRQRAISRKLGISRNQDLPLIRKSFGSLTACDRPFLKSFASAIDIFKIYTVSIDLSRPNVGYWSETQQPATSEHFQYVALINEKGAVAALTRMFFIIFRIIPPMRRRGRET